MATKGRPVMRFMFGWAGYLGRTVIPDYASGRRDRDYQLRFRIAEVQLKVLTEE
jgi:hypothetical protein